MRKSDLRHGGSRHPRWRRAALLLGAASFGWTAAMSGWPAATTRAQQTPPAATPAASPAAADDRLDQAQLEALLAPIALYPDELLMQVLMASTYPLEVVHAGRWLGQGQNAALRGDALAAALEAEPWDPSVKSLVPFPDVLIMMNDQLEWTQQLGDALLAQQEDVMNAIQLLRGRAYAAGHLKSGPEQTVTMSAKEDAPGNPAPAVAPPPQVIVIQPAQPNVVAVPVYDPSVVYGGWPYPATPPAYYPPPQAYGLGSALLTGMAFAAGVALVGSLWGWASPGWGRGSVDVNVNRYNNINVNRTQISSNTWRHDAAHRQGVAYRTSEVGNRYRPTASATGTSPDRARSREEFRGRTEQSNRGSDLAARTPGAEGRAGTADRTPGASRPADGANRPDGAARPTTRDAAARTPGTEGRAGTADRAPGASRPAEGANRPDGAARPTTRDAAARPATAPSGRPQARQQPSGTRSAPQGLQGVGEGGQVRSAQQRGEASRTASAPSGRSAPSGGTRTGGGGARTGGGGARAR
jgi:hypothetical protein